MDQRSSLPLVLRHLGKVNEELLCRLEPPDTSVAHPVAALVEFVGNRWVIKGLVVAVSVSGNDGQVGVFPVALSDGTDQRLVGTFGYDLQHSAMHRNGEPVLDMLTD